MSGPGDIIGTVYHRLTTISQEGVSKHRSKLFKCLCVCGGSTTTTLKSLRTGHTKSCGCLNREIITRHGGAYTSEYQAWHSMWSRCRNPTDQNYPSYGGRGITVDPLWEDYAKFHADMGDKPGPQFSLDRKNNALGYSKSNCRWATSEQQNNNTRFNRHLTLGGRTQTIAQWSREVGVSHATIRARLDRGWSVSEALTIPTGSIVGARSGRGISEWRLK